MYIKQSLPHAVNEVLNILGDPSFEWNQDSEWSKLVHKNMDLMSLQYMLDETIYTLRAALGLPVRRQRCPNCDARDSIYWEEEPRNSDLAPAENPGLMWCHECGSIEPPKEWVTEIIE